jgi:zinc transporter ZupT
MSAIAIGAGQLSWTMVTTVTAVTTVGMAATKTPTGAAAATRRATTKGRRVSAAYYAAAVSLLPKVRANV